MQSRVPSTIKTANLFTKDSLPTLIDWLNALQWTHLCKITSQNLTTTKIFFQSLWEYDNCDWWFRSYGRKTEIFSSDRLVVSKVPILQKIYCVKSVRIQSYSGPHFSRILLHLDWIRRYAPYLSVLGTNAEKCGENADQDNSEYRHFFCSDITLNKI